MKDRTPLPKILAFDITNDDDDIGRPMVDDDMVSVVAFFHASAVFIAKFIGGVSFTLAVEGMLHASAVVYILHRVLAGTALEVALNVNFSVDASQ